ncbi:hypothetical protein BS47DRAFT_1384245 [Hydnum rufescens UP504]|uniref:Uncharacterized protein n=1 Tax=Hydnum rufescens UP504 TaxID=1448309 RepID=A0A9P6AQ05_9AGAM|nr:hypothetical protein BS47DRAFT_1384245 [Hydnum rufescens UP504]
MGINVAFKYPTYVFMLGLDVQIRGTAFHSAGMEQEKAMSVFGKEGNKDEDGKGKNKDIENEGEANHQEEWGKLRGGRGVTVRMKAVRTRGLPFSGGLATSLYYGSIGLNSFPLFHWAAIAKNGGIIRRAKEKLDWIFLGSVLDVERQEDGDEIQDMIGVKRIWAQ